MLTYILRKLTLKLRFSILSYGRQKTALLLALSLILAGCAVGPRAMRGGIHVSNAQPFNKGAVAETEQASPIYNDREDPLVILLRDAKVDESGYLIQQENDIPGHGSKLVNMWIKYFQTRGRKHFERWLARSHAYIPFMQEILKKEGLPEELVYLSMIESGFNPHAYSKARAAGQWQFIRGTGKRYGLLIDYWVDDRRDPIKSAIAAARYLKDLYDEFESWKLATAGYNAGEGKIRRAIKRYKTDDFWQISTYKFLRAETKNYVPKMIAAAIVSRDPELYGFTDIEYELPYAFDEVEVEHQMTLSVVAKMSNTTLKEIKDLNPQIIRGVTPPNGKAYTLKLPKGTRSVFKQNYTQKIAANDSFIDYIRHTIRRGDTLGAIARKYGVSVDAIIGQNTRLRPRSLSIGQTVTIPVGKAPRAYAADLAKKETAAKPAPEKQQFVSAGPNDTLHKVRFGETLYEISIQYGVSVRNIMRANRIRSARHLRAGQRIVIPGTAKSDTITASPVS